MENVQTGQDGRNLLKISTLPSTKQNTNAQGGVSQHLVGSPNEFMRGCKCLDGAPVVTTVGWTLYHKLDDVSTSLMRSRHLICNTRYVVIRCKLLSSVKILYHENPFGELTKRSETATRYNCSPPTQIYPASNYRTCWETTFSSVLLTEIFNFNPMSSRHFFRVINVQYIIIFHCSKKVRKHDGCRHTEGEGARHEVGSFAVLYVV